MREMETGDKELDAELETHRKHLYSFYSACNVLRNDSESSYSNPSDSVTKKPVDKYDIMNDCYYVSLNSEFGKRAESLPEFIKIERDETDECVKDGFYNEIKGHIDKYYSGAENNRASDGELSSSFNDRGTVSIKSENQDWTRSPEDNLEWQPSNFELYDSISAVSKTKYTCYHCNRDFSRKKSMRKHVLVCQYSAVWKRRGPNVKKRKAFRIGNWMIKCHKCDRKFPQKASLKRHLDSNSCSISCEVCGYIPRKPCELKRHMVKHTRERIFCPHCDKKFSRPYMLTKHLSEHQITVYRCVRCPKKFIRSEELKNHESTAHSEVDKNFRSEQMAHRETDENTEKTKFLCKLCQIYFEIERNYLRHMAKHSSPSFVAKPHVCHVCGKRFVKRFSLILHKAVCLESVESSGDNDSDLETDVKFFCKFCDGYFTSAIEFQNHKAVHSVEETKPFGCAHCEKRFIQRYSLINHLTCCTPKRGLRGIIIPSIGKLERKNNLGESRFSCLPCNLHFSVEAHYKRHVAKHSLPLDDRKPYTCDMCQKRFTKRETITRHIHVHLGLITNECPTCERKFSQKSSMMRHIDNGSCYASL